MDVFYLCFGILIEGFNCLLNSTFCVSQACISWEPSYQADGQRLRGYRILVDRKRLGGLRDPDIQLMVIRNLVPCKTISINIVAESTAQESEPSKTVHITCPSRPTAPCISQQPSYKRGCVLIAWSRPTGFENPRDRVVLAYSIFLDGKWHGQMKSEELTAQEASYHFFLTDLSPEQCYDVSVTVSCYLILTQLLISLVLTCMFTDKHYCFKNGIMPTR